MKQRELDKVIMWGFACYSALLTWGAIQKTGRIATGGEAENYSFIDIFFGQYGFPTWGSLLNAPFADLCFWIGFPLAAFFALVRILR